MVKHGEPRDPHQAYLQPPLARRQSRQSGQDSDLHSSQRAPGDHRKRHLVAYAVVNTLDAEPAPDSGSLRKDLIRAVDTLRRAFSGPLGQALPGLVTDMAHDPELARIIRKEVLGRRRSSIKNAILRGIARAEIRSDVHVDVLIDLLTAPCYFRLLFGHARITRPFVETVVDYALCAVKGS
jgi:hypothetical protein